MNRRTFLKTSCLAVLPVLGTGCSNVLFRSEQKEKPLFTFIQLTDTHVNAPYDDQTVYTGANQRMQWFVDSLNDGTIPQPDFIVHTGDMIHGGTLEKLGPDMEFFKMNVLIKLPVPFYPCVGNRENVQRSGIPEYDQEYINTFGVDKKNYTFERKGIVFVVFDNSSDPPWGHSSSIVRNSDSSEMNGCEVYLPKIKNRRYYAVIFPLSRCVRRTF